MKYYFLKTDIFPHEFADGESVILIQDEEDNSEVQEENLEFITTLLVKSQDETIALEEFSSWWHESTTGGFELELLTEEMQHLNKERKNFVQSLDEGGWSLKDNFIAYVKGDVESQKYAREIILESEFQVQ